MLVNFEKQYYVTHYRYGLFVPKKINQGALQPRLAVFGDVSDSDNEDGADWVKKALRVCMKSMNVS